MVPVDKALSMLGSSAAIPIGLVVLIIYLTIWGTHVNDQLEVHAGNVTKVQENHQAMLKTLQHIDKSLNRFDRRIDRIETALHIKHGVTGDADSE